MNRKSLSDLCLPGGLMGAHNDPMPGPVPESRDDRAKLWRAVVLSCAVVSLLLAGAGLGSSQPGEQVEVVEEVVEEGQSDCIVILRDGRRISGKLVDQNDDGVIVRIHGIDTPFDWTVVGEVELLKPLRERYRIMRAAIGDEDVDRLLLLVDWCVSHGLIAEAMSEVEHVLEIDPDNPNARDAARYVKGQFDLETKEPGRERTPRDGPERPEKIEFPLLTEEQVNLIKVYEVDLSNAPRLVIKRETIERLIDEYRDNEHMPRTLEGREALFRRSPVELLELMFRIKARPLYNEVQVVGNPASMMLFRERVHRTWLLNSCATARCHGGSEAGRLMLNGRRANSDESVYTNFLIMDRFRLDDGTPLINYAEPADSPLLQMGLPEEISRRPHPPVPIRGRVGRWKPTFRSERDSRFEEAVAWIRSMYQPRPDYPIDYEPPSPSVPIRPAHDGPRVPR